MIKLVQPCQVREWPRAVSNFDVLTQNKKIDLGVLFFILILAGGDAPRIVFALAKTNSRHFYLGFFEATPHGLFSR